MGLDWHVKLLGFGLAKNTDDSALRTHNICTYGYMAPELFDNTPGEYTSAVDVWAIGAVAFSCGPARPPSALAGTYSSTSSAGSASRCISSAPPAASASTL
ncbi:protein kinase [Candidatus Bathyarchaeota archaeon]|nr:protein kinase [Candidatus Bathyarchaeota archaeon]